MTVRRLADTHSVSCSDRITPEREVFDHRARVGYACVQVVPEVWSWMAISASQFVPDAVGGGEISCVPRMRAIRE